MMKNDSLGVYNRPELVFRLDLNNFESHTDSSDYNWLQHLTDPCSYVKLLVGLFDTFALCYKKITKQ